jgi:formamidopyrimidine-DNA glycosylase
MPELPEVATARRLIADLALGRLIIGVDDAARSSAGRAHTGDVIAARRPGASCPRCGAEMVHGTVGGRSTWWCSREQAAWS